MKRLFFFTYYRLVPTGQIGIFKRCMRLIEHLLDDFEVHVVNYGPLPDEDALFASIAPRLHIHEPPADDDELGRGLMAILEDVDPVAVVIGETPLRGSMRLSHRVARHLGIWQICIENYYGEFLEWFLPKEWTGIDRWLLLGLVADGAVGKTAGSVEVVPPFVHFPSPSGAPKDRVCVIGYDKQTLLTGAQLLRRLPADEQVDFLIAPQWRAFLERQKIDLTRPGLRVLELPTDVEIYDSLARAKLVLGKAGFQQVVESISLGAPVICQAAGGGLEDMLVPDYLKPLVRFVDDDDGLAALMFDIAGWLLEPPVTVWSDLATKVEHPMAYAASRLATLVDQRPS